MNIRSVVRSALVLLLAPLAAACYQSTLPLGPPERGTIDRALVGSWSCVDPKDATNRAVVTSRPLDAHRYAIEWREEPDHVTRYRAYSTRVGKEVLLNVEEVDSTGPIRGSCSSAPARSPAAGCRSPSSRRTP